MTASAAHSILPSLSADEEQHSRAAAALIRAEIVAAAGWLSFARFMELALYAPGFGYYSAGSAKIGPGGDFVTAPEVSDLFSRCLARQCAEVLRSTGGGILELGAGTGRMAVTLLESLSEAGMLPDRYAILEVSADLAERQRARIQRLPRMLRERVAWLQRLPETPLRGLVLANEVLDALPFHRFVVRTGEVRELGVALDGEAFIWRECPDPGLGQHDLGHEKSHSGHGQAQLEREQAELQMAAATLMRDLPVALPEGYTSEICLGIAPWIAGVGHCIDRGVLLLFDYGLPRSHYYHPQRTDGTLRCHFKHRAHGDPLINVAVQDITAWVDFTRVAEAAVCAGLDVVGFATQAAFLLGTGIEELTAAAAGAAEQVRLAGEARRLLLPGEMGESFKVMALSRDMPDTLSGFVHQDLRRSL